MSLFNEKWYLANNPDVAEAVKKGLLTAQQHYDLYGKYENRQPSPAFDPEKYLNDNPDVAAAVDAGLISAYDHFVTYGHKEDRSPSALFDAEVYLANNPDVKAALDAGLLNSAFEHFQQYGQYEPRTVSPFIDLQGYLNDNPDVAAAVDAGLITAFDHFINYGFKEGRSIGNGITLAQFANDPEAQAAIQNGDISGLMARVSEVAPFLATYEAPDGYDIPSNIPIPVDFQPVGDEKLVIPEGVEVPDDLPPTFVLDTVTTGYGKVSRVGMDVPAETEDSEANNLWVGGGNSADNFHVTRTDRTKVELALKGYVRGTGDVVDADQDGVYEFGTNDKVGFAYSVASLGDQSLQDLINQGYSFHLKIDIDRGSGTEFVEFELAPEETFGSGQDSGLKWVRAGGDPIIDDEGLVTEDATFSTQNIQTPLWYGTGLDKAGASGALKSGEYSIVLEMRSNGKAIAAEEITLDVSQSYSLVNASLSDVALKDDGTMLNGSGNPGDRFSVTRIDYDQDGDADIEIALGAQQRRGPDIYTPDENGVINVPEGHTPVFKFSVANLKEDATLADLLATYDIKLYVDHDPSENTDFIQLTAVANSDDSTGALDWVFADPRYKLIDDKGNEHVSQNIQALEWYTPGEEGGLFGEAGTFGPGEYTVRLEVLEKDSDVLVGVSQLTFDVPAA